MCIEGCGTSFIGGGGEDTGVLPIIAVRVLNF